MRFSFATSLFTFFVANAQPVSFLNASDTRPNAPFPIGRMSWNIASPAGCAAVTSSSHWYLTSTAPSLDSQNAPQCAFTPWAVGAPALSTASSTAISTTSIPLVLVLWAASARRRCERRRRPALGLRTPSRRRSRGCTWRAPPASMTNLHSGCWNSSHPSAARSAVLLASRVSASGHAGVTLWLLGSPFCMDCASPTFWMVSLKSSST